MVNQAKAKYYCCEDISLIENYDEAMKSDKRWDCHHRMELQDDKILTQQEMIKLGLYYKRPASELIFLSHSEHVKLHYKYKPYSEEAKQKISNSLNGNIPWNKGKTNVYSEETRKKMSISATQRKRPGK